MLKVSQFILWHGNKYAADEVVKLNNFVSGKLVQEKVTKCIFTFVEDEKEQYRNFREERFVEKRFKLTAGITKVNLPMFKTLPQQPKIGKANIKAMKK